MQSDASENLVLHVLVVGFHHKRGCQVDFCYPPIQGEDSHCGSNQDGVSCAVELPEVWKTLPSLALPDGAHNYDQDTVYFHLPDLEDNHETIYGISCYRQIMASQLIAKTQDVTRTSVQKSVVVLSKVPLYGLIEAKLSLITHAYFRELDFSKVELLKDTYTDMNSGLTRDMLQQTSQLYYGLSGRRLISKFGHKAVTLFKLMLLEKRVLFFGSPAKDVCALILTLCSLIPGMLDCDGMKNSCVTTNSKSDTTKERRTSQDIELNMSPDSSPDKETGPLQEDQTPKEPPTPSVFWTKEKEDSIDFKGELKSPTDPKPPPAPGDPVEDLINDIESELKTGEAGKDDGANSIRSSTPPLLKLNVQDCGLPLHLFRKGSFCLPYISLTYLDILSDIRVRTFMVGASNILSKQRRQLFDAIVDVNEAKIDFVDRDLAKALNLTTEDLRFADFLYKTVVSPSEANGEGSSTDQDYTEDLFQESGWEGGEEWIRYEYKVYLLHLLRAAEMNSNYNSFNVNFMDRFKCTHHYKMWLGSPHPAVYEIYPNHPFGGQLSVSDMRLKLSHAVFYTDRGKKLNATVSQTGKVVGSALVNARSTVSGWWSSWNAAPSSSASAPSPHSKSDESTNATTASNGSAPKQQTVTATESEYRVSQPTSEGKIVDL